MSKVTKVYGNTCVVELELPWEVAELLVEQGPALLEEISIALRMRRQRTEHNQKFAALREQDRQQAKEDFYNLGRVVDEALQASNSNKKEILKKLAIEHDVVPSFLERVRALYVQKQKEQRKADVVRYYFAGFTNSQIGEKVGMSAGAVAMVLKREGNLLEAIKRLHSGAFAAQEGGK
ncbi:hypothetical protein [Terasakiella pusilla]|uniref:hypothetical protein n=1 Tax=Terasakiella pusilla TaxID=64973 RepID=UPI0004904BBA|nr:hypothetical protein [Terasakiella pusilla]